MKNGGKNKSIAFIILFSVVMSVPETVNVLDLLDVRDPLPPNPKLKVTVIVMAQIGSTRVKQPICQVDY
jgi:hypothetical protein